MRGFALSNQLRTPVAILVAILFTFQAIFTFFVNLPSNYISQHYSGGLYSYMLPYFSQSWSLFAPNPGGGNPHTAFRYSFTSRDGKVRTTPWMDGNALFSQTNFANPFSRLGLEREMYYGEVLIATNGIGAIRKSIATRKVALDHPIDIEELPETVLSVERIYMALAPAFIAVTKPKNYLVQVAFSDNQPISFDEVFDKKPLRKHNAATLILPWVQGQYVEPFVSGVVNR